MVAFRLFPGYLDGIDKGIALVDPNRTSRESSKDTERLACETATFNYIPPWRY